MPAAIAPRSSNGFAGLTLVGVTDTSITFDLWYRSNTDINNRFYYYDYYTKEWIYIYQSGNPGTSQRYTVTGLNPGAYYWFICTTYDFPSASWKNVEVKVQTSGAKTPALSVAAQGATSFTVTALFPSEHTWGNKLTYFNWDTKTWDDITGYGTASAKSGTYTRSGLIPGQNYFVNLMYYDSFTQQWSKIELNLTLQLPRRCLSPTPGATWSFSWIRHLSVCWAVPEPIAFWTR